MSFLKPAFMFIFLALSLFIQGCERSNRAEVKKEKIGDIELAYYMRGHGDPLVMIMGFRGTMAIWDPGLLELLEKKYTLILFDNRGAGLSSDNKEPMTISQMAEDTAQLIKALGFQKANVLGWSMGSRIALELSIKHPEIVASLILCSPNPGGDHQTHRKTSAYDTLTSKELTLEEGLSLIFPDTPEGHRTSDALISRLTLAIIKGTVPNNFKVSDETVNRQAEALKLWDEDNRIYESLPDIKTPTLVADGLDDVLDQPENVRIVSCKIPFAWTAYFAGAGHYFLSQDYRHFAELVDLFIESNTTANRQNKAN